MTIQIKPEVFNKAFLPFMSDTRRTQLLYGGAGSGKSYAIAQRCVLQSFKKNNNMLVARKYGNTNRNSTFRQIRNIISTWNLSTYFTIYQLRIINNVTNTQLLFTGLDDVQKIKSVSGIKIIWIQQASQITKDDFIQLNIRLRGRINDINLHYMVWLSFNPTSKNHWIRYQFFKEDGQPREGCTNNRSQIKSTVSFYHTTYKDNKYIDQQYIQVLQAYKDLSPYHYDVYALGKWGTFGQLVFPNFKIQQFDRTAILSLSSYVSAGQDFGFNDPSVSLLASVHDQTIYIVQQLYGKKWTNTDLTYNLNNTQYIKDYPIYADSAQPQRIIQLQQRGLNVKGVVKKTIKQSINNIKTMPIIIHPSCIRAIEQISNYQYQKDKKTNQYSDSPIQINNHCMDSLRYALMNYFMQVNTSNFIVRGT